MYLGNLAQFYICNIDIIAGRAIFTIVYGDGGGRGWGGRPLAVESYSSGPGVWIFVVFVSCESRAILA